MPTGPSNPGQTIVRSAAKVLRLWVFDPYDGRATHPFRVAAWALLVVLSFLGYREIRPPPYLVAYVAYATIMAAVFFALLRHQVLMEIALIPLAGHGLARFCTFTRLSRKERTPTSP